MKECCRRARKASQKVTVLSLIQRHGLLLKAVLRTDLFNYGLRPETVDKLLDKAIKRTDRQFKSDTKKYARKLYEAVSKKNVEY